jgi:hypothetical protein
MSKHYSSILLFLADYNVKTNKGNTNEAACKLLKWLRCRVGDDVDEVLCSYLRTSSILKMAQVLDIQLGLCRSFSKPKLWRHFTKRYNTCNKTPLTITIDGIDELEEKHEEKNQENNEEESLRDALLAQLSDHFETLTIGLAVCEKTLQAIKKELNNTKA